MLSPMPESNGSVSSRRARSRERLLTALRQEGPLTRGDLSQLTGLSGSAVAKSVQDLIAHGLVSEQPPRREGGGRGRPSALLTPVAGPGVVAGIDFGHSHISAAIARTTGEIVAVRRRPNDVDQDAVAALDMAAALVQECLTETRPAAATLDGVAAGLPGPVDRATGRVRSPTILSTWSHIDPAQALSSRLGTTVAIGNDADMGALGEMTFGAARGCRNFIYVKASAGLGAGLVFNGQTYRGGLGLAGEIGHIPIRADGERCRCGSRGCLETVASAPAVVRQLAAAGIAVDRGGAHRSLATLGEDRIANRVIAEAGRTLGTALAGICNCLNPEAIIVGGELATAGESFSRAIEESIVRYALPDIAEAVSIRQAELGLKSELMGAVTVAARQAHVLVTPADH